MSSASRSVLLDLIARPDFIGLVRGQAVVILDDELETVLYADAAASHALGLSAARALPPLLARQIRSNARRATGSQTAQLLLRVPFLSNGAAQPAALTRLDLGERGVALLALPRALDAPRNDPAHLLVELGLQDESAALFGPGGLLATGSGLTMQEEAALVAIAQKGAEHGSLATEAATAFGRVRLFPIEEDRRLLWLERDAATGAPATDEETDAAVDPAPPAGDRLLPTAAGPMNIAAIVGRWHSRQSDPAQADDATDADPAAAPFSANRRTLRSAWGPVSTPSSPEPTGEEAEADGEKRSIAPPGDEEDRAGEDAAQPIERDSVITLPDLSPEEAARIDPPLHSDVERPEGGDLLPDGAQARPVAPAAEPQAILPPSGETAFVPRFDDAPVRFVWQVDSEARFRSFSPEFAQTVGPQAAAVIGHSFAEVAEAFGLDENREIRRLLERRDTWSNRTVLWPVQGTDKRVPIDLAALPIYARDRSFDGFRGFGIIRRADHETDAEGLGLALPPIVPLETPAPDVPVASPSGGKPILRSFDSELPGVSFGRRQVAPLPAPPEQPVEPAKVVRLPDRFRASETSLTPAEEAAFREIGEKLGQDASKRVGAPTMPAASVEAAAHTRPEEKEPSGTDADRGGAAASGSSAPKGNAPDAVAPETPPDSAVLPPDIEPFLAALPLPVLVQGQSEVVFANAALLDLGGFESVADLNRAGGLGALFSEQADEASSGNMNVRHAGGTSREMRVHMQRISFSGRSSLLMSFEAPARPAAIAAPPPLPEIADFRQEAGELRAVLDIATDGVVLVDPQGSIRAVNGSAQALFGMHEDEFKGRAVTTLFAHESQKTVLEYIETMKDKGLAGVLNDGREVIGRVSQGGFVPLFVTLGRLSEERGWCLVIRDMSHWKRIEEELVGARRAAEAASLHKSRFLANISHELRTPLNAIIGFADVMASECFGPIGHERYIEYLGDIKRSGHHVLDLVNDLLDISKIEAGKMELTFESVSLNEVLAEAVAVMQPQANRERVIVRSNLPASVPPVVADRRTIRQIALNLLSNSVRFTPAGGQIIASTTYTAEGDVLLRVRDSGIGMTEREIEIALAPFQQIHQPGAPRGEGTGLGLPLTKAMAEANRASFVIRSAPGEGTLVEIGFSSQRVLAD